MTIRRAYIVVFICVIITTQSTSAGSHGAGVICGQQRCAKYVEYCDPLIEICTSCVLACSRTTIADSNLCKRLCPGFVPTAGLLPSVFVTADTTVAPAVELDAKRPYVLVGCLAAAVLLSIVITIFLVRKFGLYQRSSAQDTMITPEATSLTGVLIQERRRGCRSEFAVANSGTSINKSTKLLYI
ncbi:hypothetical protein NP493_99g01029 [Ridgeia piscesae]|uniref:TNFR-Cys domain-containing protein n=1 Tax=Ridgeia piscesae TaxID=27915 RepID=A0AAD9P7Q1_RIDPI|nr:hypothetical protein NP493_99g01029 [Ridgeia piscesae]